MGVFDWLVNEFRLSDMLSISLGLLSIVISIHFTNITRNKEFHEIFKHIITLVQLYVDYLVKVEKINKIIQSPSSSFDVGETKKENSSEQSIKLKAIIELEKKTYAVQYEIIGKVLNSLRSLRRVVRGQYQVPTVECKLSDNLDHIHKAIDVYFDSFDKFMIKNKVYGVRELWLSRKEYSFPIFVPKFNCFLVINGFGIQKHKNPMHKIRFLEKVSSFLRHHRWIPFSNIMIKKVNKMIKQKVESQFDNHL